MLIKSKSEHIRNPCIGDISAAIEYTIHGEGNSCTVHGTDLDEMKIQYSTVMSNFNNPDLMIEITCEYGARMLIRGSCIQSVCYSERVFLHPSISHIHNPADIAQTLDVSRLSFNWIALTDDLREKMEHEDLQTFLLKERMMIRPS